MKNLLLIIVSIISLTKVNAQDEEGKVSIETQFDVLSKNYYSNNNLKVRYHFNKTHVLRTNWEFSFNNDKQEILEANGDGVGSLENLDISNIISIGYERHFSSEKFSPYLGASFGFGFGKSDIYGSRTDGFVFVNDFNFVQTQKTSAYKGYLFTGFDFDLYKGLYFGSELGFSFMSKKTHRGEITTEDASSTTNASVTTTIPENSQKTFSLANMGIIRLGWKF